MHTTDAGVAPNNQNDVVYCEKGHESWSNLVLLGKSDLKNVLNLYLLVGFQGIEYFLIFSGEFDQELYKFILQEIHARVKALKLKREFSRYFHDHCQKGAKPVEELNRCFGADNLGKTPQAPCKTKIGARGSNCTIA
eukprot:Lithocolla_globosa_v1_NODE_11403_length_512_cov_1.161926.p1 type:complete len:137 gc:universal NODE_11403_length_512_cov_1.161926:72-482(+)